MCWAAKGLIALCVGYLPMPGSHVNVERQCIKGFPQKTRAAAEACASQNKVTWHIR